jgi:hypothetical protein
MNKVNNVNRLMVLLLCFAAAQALGAQENPDAVETPPADTGSGRELTVQISSLPEAKLLFTQRFVFPFLEGQSPLTENNNIAIALTAELSPISVNGEAEAVWTPIAFFQLAAGGRIGSGWNITLFGNDVYGIGLNREKQDDSRKAEHSGSAFDGLFWKVKTGGTLQFDLAALVPGDWNHLVARSYHEINYRGYTAAASGESWYYENDYGENINGFNYYGNVFVGYQMPIVLNTAGILAEADLYLYDTPGRASWGDDKIRWTLSALLNFTVTEKLSAAVLVQCRLLRNYTNPDWEDLYYRNRRLDTSSPLRFTFYRAALAFTYRL